MIESIFSDGSKNESNEYQHTDQEQVFIPEPRPESSLELSSEPFSETDENDDDQEPTMHHLEEGLLHRHVSSNQTVLLVNEPDSSESDEFARI